MRRTDTETVIRRPLRQSVKPTSLFRFLASKGGLRPNPELKYILDGNPFVPGMGCLIRLSGMSLDHAREACVESGYLWDAAEQHGGVTESTINDLLSLIGTESHGSKCYPANATVDSYEDAMPSNMPPEEYRSAIANLGLSQVKAGKFLGVDPRTSRRWASGEAEIPEAIAKLLRTMVRHQLAPDDIEQLSEAKN